MASVAFLAILAATWLRGGTHPAWSWPLLWISLVGLLSLPVACVWSSRIRREPFSGAPVLRWKDPVLWFGLILIALLAVQWWNAGRILYYDPAARAWAYSAPRHPALPSAITSLESRQMLDWFVPAFVLLILLRSPSFSARGVRLLWRLVVCSAAVLSVFGLLQFLSGTEKMFGFIPMRPHFFASFGYPNHAGSYFLIAMCLCAALLVHELSRPDAIRRGRMVLLSVCFVLCLLGANFALSRASILASWFLLLPIGLLVLRAVWFRLGPAQRVNMIALSLAAVVLAMILTFGLGQEAIRTEFKPEDDNKTLLTRETDFRIFQIESAARIWRDHPWYGVGGWGYRYLMAHYLPPEQWQRVTEGKANVHNDPIQFLAEFGLIGGGAMAAVVLVLGVEAWRRRAGAPPLLLLPLMGVGIVGLQSLIDLPFRSPAVLMLWLCAFAGAIRLVPIRPILLNAEPCNDMVRRTEVAT